MKVVVDTREQCPWDFKSSRHVTEIVTEKLDTGDYSLSGYEEEICIERKKSPAEVARNVFDSRFERELDRMELYKFKYIICEFTLEELLRYPKDSNLPIATQKRIKAGGKIVTRKLLNIMVDRDIPVIFAGDAKVAEQAAAYLMSQAWNVINGKEFT